MTGTTTSTDLFSRAQQVIPSGVNSPVRAFGSVGGTPPFLTEAKGALLHDADGNEYVDLVGSWGPMILGHADDRVVEAVREAAGRGLSFGAPQPGEVGLAEEVTARIGPVEQLRLVNSGTEATMSALRVARAATARDTVVLPYGDRSAVASLFAERGQEIAAIITEAAPANMGVVTPPEQAGVGFNSYLAETAHAHGALLISDEVLTGFRASAEGHYGIDGADRSWAPDLMTFGKVIGGGLPVGAFGGRKDLMSLLAPAGPVYQAGTLSGNPLATAAGLATLEGLDAAAYETLGIASRTLQQLVADAFTTAGVPHVIQTAGTLFSVFFREQPVRTYEDAKAQDTEAFTRFFHAMLEGGIYLPPSAFEAWFVSTAHTPEILDRIAAVLPGAAAAAARG